MPARIGSLNDALKYAEFLEAERARLATALSLAQTEIKGHMRIEDNLKQELMLADRAIAETVLIIERAQARIAALEKDAARWRKGVSDGEFPIRRSGQWMHVSRTSGRILTGETPEEVIDAALKDHA